MTTYKEIKGTNIEVLESDPSNPLDGQVWYNSTDNVLKGNVGTPVVAWSTVSSLNQSRTSVSGAGTSALAASGFNPPSPAGRVTKVESWNGTNWTEINDVNSHRNDAAGAGQDNTTGFMFGGYDYSAPVN